MAVANVVKEKSKRKRDFSAFNIFNIFIMVLLSLVTVYPFWYVIMASLTSNDSISAQVYFLWPHAPTLNAYRMVFSTHSIANAYRNTLFITIVGTAISLTVTALLAYPLSRRRLRGGKVILAMIFFTFLFSGGIVPTFWVVRSLGLLNTLWAMILPQSVTVVNTLLMVAFFKGIPDSLEESAAIEGANDLHILFRIVFPLSMPVFATITLFYSVMYWNSWIPALLYVQRQSLHPLQMILRNIVQFTDMSAVGGQGDLTMANLTMQSVRMATIMVAILPIMCVYPFLQKYFVKGVMIGAIKS